MANVEGNQALQLAAEAGFPEVAKVLLDKGVSPDAVNKVRTSTPLHASSECCNPPRVPPGASSEVPSRCPAARPS